MYKHEAFITPQQAEALLIDICALLEVDDYDEVVLPMIRAVVADRLNDKAYFDTVHLGGDIDTNRWRVNDLERANEAIKNIRLQHG